MKEDLKELDLLSEIYKELRKNAIKFAEDAIRFAKDVAENVRNFKYFCAILVIYSIVFVALGIYFLRIPESFTVTLSLLILCGINVLYAILLWKDYAKTVRKYKDLIAAEAELREIKQRVEELDVQKNGFERS